MTVVADVHEGDVPFEKESLPCGDFVITGENDGLLIERKEWTDLVTSYRKGRLYQQLAKCHKQDYRVALLIEGNRNDAIKYCSSSNNEIRGFLAALIADEHDLQLIFTKRRSETINLIRDIDRHFNDSSDSTHRIRPVESVPPSKRPQYILEGFPGIGPGTAEKLIKEFGSVKNVLDASEEELTKVKGIGPKTAKSIQDSFTRNVG